MTAGLPRRKNPRRFAVAALLALLLTGCFSPRRGDEPLPPPLPPPGPPALRTLGHAVQVGAFSRLDFAGRLEEDLKNQGLDAFFFLDQDGLYKVRFGDYPGYREARAEALRLRARGMIGEFFIVSPRDYPAARIGLGSRDPLREEIAATARRFIGVPYKWGGTSAKKGFDCSGLALVVYRLNGLDLPRASFQQFEAGRAVPDGDLRQGDLVFFATRGPNRVSHVGIYLGSGRFIHAPRSGLTVRISSLASPYYARRYLGGRSYL